MLPLKLAVAVFLVVIGNTVVAEDPYRYFDWNVTYGTIYPLGVPQQVDFSAFFCLDLDFLDQYAHLMANFCFVCVGNFD